jgi:hypothetical protein
MAGGMRIFLVGGLLSVLIFCFAASAANPYSTWQYTRNIVLNTNPSGANIASGTNVTNFPVLVRLSGKGSNGGNAADSAVFAQAQSNGIDIRFTKYNGTSFPFQRMRWDNTNKLAEFWVLVDTVFGGDSAIISPTGYMQMFWGNGTVGDASNGASVFDSATNGYSAVYHLQDTTDASSSNFPLSAPSANKPTLASSAIFGGIIGVPDTFNGSTFLHEIDSTSAEFNSRLNFPFGGPYTYSAWAYIGKQPAAPGFTICGKGNVNNELFTSYGSPWNFVLMDQANTGNNSVNLSTPSTEPANFTWYHVVAVRSGTSNTSDSLYINGALVATTQSNYSGTGARNTTHPFTIGKLGDASVSGTNARNWIGKIDEVQVSNVARTTSWARLSWANQCQPSIASGLASGVDSLTIKGPALLNAPPAPALIAPTNGAVGQPATVALSWGSSFSATSYTVNVSTTSSFASTAYSASGNILSASPTLVGGLTYYWQVSASNGLSSSYSPIWSFATAATFGQNPVMLIPPPANGSLNVSITPTLTWNAVVSATAYELEVSSNNNGFAAPVVYDVATLTGTSQIPTGLVNSQTYYWRVNAYNAGNPAGGAGNGWSATWSFTTIVAQPGAPVLSLPVSGSVSEPLTLSLSWAAGTGGAPASYTIEISTGSAFSNTVFMQAGQTNSSTSAANLANNTQYYWQVSSTNAAGTSGWSGAWSFTTIVTAPGAPISPTPANGAINQLYPSLTLQWSPGSGGLVASYNLNFGTSTAFSTTVAGGIGTPSYVVGSLTSSTTYYWQVQAVNVASAAWSAIWSFTTNENYGQWTGNQSITLNTSPTGANTTIGEHFFPVLLRLNTGNAASFFTAEAGASNPGADLRFANPTTGNHLPYELNKINMTTMTALVWVAVDTIYAGNATQSITMYYGNSSALSQSDSANVFVPANGFGAVLHLNKRHSTGTYNVFSDATGSGNIGNGSNTLGDTTCAVGTGLSGCAFDSAACFHLTGPGNNILSGDSIQIASLLGSHSAITMSAWIRTDSLDQYNTGGNGHQATLISMDDYDNLCISGAYGSATDSLTAAWYSGSGWANYGWPSASLTGTNPQLNQSNTTGHAIGTHNGWKYVAFVLNPSASTPIENLYVNGDSVRSIGVTNGLAWTGGNGSSGYRTVLGKQATNSNVGERFGGSMVEMRIDTTIRTSDWIHLCYENQGATDYLTNPPPQMPVLSAPSNGASVAAVSPVLSLDWSAPATGPSPTSYAAQVSTSSTFGSTVFLQSGITGTYVVPSGLVVGTLYYWQVSATNAGGTGAWSGAWNFNAIAGAPTLSSPANGALDLPSSLNLTWNAIPGATSYSLQVSNSSGFGTFVYSNSSLTTASAAITVTAGMTYYWEVNVTINSTTSAWSSIWSFATSTTQAIPLITSWNMTSFNLVPPNDSATAVFGSVPGGFLFVKDNAGDVYCPTLSENDIKIVQPGQGYQVYTNVPDTFKLTGEPVNVATTPVALSAGWNLIGYLPSTDDSIVHALAAIDSQLVLVKNDSGHIYWPALAVDNINTIHVGQGYKTLMSSAASLYYPTPLAGVAKHVAGIPGKPMLRLPAPKHYAIHAITGNNATLLAKQVLFGDKLASDSSEIGAFDPSGTLVGSGTVIHGIAAFAVWGKDQQTKTGGCVASEPVTFKLWNGKQEYPLEYTTLNKSTSQYAEDKVFLGELRVPEGYLISRFDLTRAYPNPFNGSVKIAFDVPTIAGISQHAVEINVYDLNGSLVKQLAKGIYQAGHYVLAWNCNESREASVGSSVYVVRMKANNFDKRLKLVRVQ